MPYRSPVEEFKFIFENVVGYDRLAETELFRDADPETSGENTGSCGQVGRQRNRATPAKRRLASGGNGQWHRKVFAWLRRRLSHRGRSGTDRACRRPAVRRNGHAIVASERRQRNAERVMLISGLGPAAFPRANIWPWSATRKLG